MDPLAQPTPPPSETTAAQPEPTTPVGPAADPVPAAEPGPASPTTQELRLAVVLTGGVSLAIWMGGVCREIDLLNQASDPDARATDGRTGSDRRVCQLYRRLLDLLDVRVSLDVLSGTSAGGINAALLGMANARRRDTGAVRDLWMDAGAFDQLLRDPRRPDPPSLLRGDDFLLAKLRDAIGTIAAGTPPPDPRPTHVFITTTLLSAEMSRFTDNYGTLIVDADHHGLFHFTEELLAGAAPDFLASRLALAARSSASFPGAFEPAFLPYKSETDTAHPDMSAYLNASAPHWASDGGLLVNRPIAPLLQEIFERAASGQVRRVLLYIVPSSRPVQAPEPDRFDKPPSLGEALMRDLSATLNQSIAADLAAIRDHNDRVTAVAETRLRLAALGVRLDRAERDSGSVGLTVLIDAPAWRDYRQRQAEWLVRPLTAAVMRQVSADPALRDRWLDSLGPGSDGEHRLRTAAGASVVRNWPAQPPTSVRAVVGVAASLGRPALDAAKATILDILVSGYVLTDDPDARAKLAACGARIHGASTAWHDEDLQTFVAKRLGAAPAGETLDQAVVRLAGEFVGQAGPTAGAAADPAVDGDVGATIESYLTAWRTLADALIDVRDLLRRLAGDVPTGRPTGDEELADAPVRLSLLQRRSEAAYRVNTYLDFLLARDVPRTVARLLDLHIAERSVLPVGVDVQQRVELVQVSADTRTLLDPGRSTAEDKLTGMQLHHFGAFYKGSWRANDWMWGRLDGAGWLVHLLLDPRRILSVLETAGIDGTDRAGWFLGRIEEIAGPAPETCPDGSLPTRGELLAELAFLSSDAVPLPASLPRLSLWVARSAQQAIAAEELGTVARQVRAGTDGAPSRLEQEWLASYDAAPPGDPAAMAALLSTCPVPAQRLTDRDQTESPLFIRTLTQAVAVTTAAATALTSPPAFLRPTFATARSITRTAYVATDRMHGSRSGVLTAALGMMAFGVLAMLTHNVVLGLSGLGLVGAGAVMLAVALWRATPTILASLVAVALVLIAAAPWLPWADERLFGWLQRSAVPWMREQRWAWSVLFLLVLLPPLEALVRLFGRAVDRVRELRLIRALLRAARLDSGAPVPAAPVPAPAVPRQQDAAGSVTSGTGHRPQ
ncbi:patatin-like protein [Rugosimonospora africana]|uniref:Putative membrane protein n=1 Tax=Rugosimonospora africana TaxID=556532 RepID=A0A8J3R1X1_9ACTN|nr:patatin-like protein [Rugosimonospora africana]GIH20264.1 putative membrane protein [Rugosimonospora africana]